MSDTMQIPSYPLTTAADRLARAYATIGNRPDYSRADMAYSLGYTNAQSGRFSALMTTLQLYGFIGRMGSRYTFERRFTDWFIDKNGAAGKRAMMEAVVAPEPFLAIYEQFKNSRLPHDVSDWLLHYFHGSITTAIAAQLAALFAKNAAAVGLVKDGFLREITPPSEMAGVLDQNYADPTDRTKNQNAQLSQSAAHFAFAVYEKDLGSGRVIKITVPADLSQDERDHLMAVIQYL